MIGGISIPVIVGDDGRSIKTQLPTQDDLIQDSLMEDIQASDVAGGQKGEEIRQLTKLDKLKISALRKQPGDIPRMRLKTS
jgi:hypothetical protein